MHVSLQLKIFLSATNLKFTDSMYISLNNILRNVTIFTIAVTFSTINQFSNLWQIATTAYTEWTQASKFHDLTTS